MQQRLPLFISLIVLCIILAFSGVSYIGVKKAAIQIGAERLSGLSEQLSSMFGQSAQSLAAATRNIAAQPSLKNNLRSDVAETDTAAMNTLLKLRPDSTWVAAELLDANRTVKLQTVFPGIKINLDRDSVISPLSLGPDSCTVGKLYQLGDSLYYPVVATVTDNNMIIGYLVRWRLQLATKRAIEQFSQLLGANAHLYIGNKDGSLWSDLSKPVAPPAVDTATLTGLFNYFRPGIGKVVATGQPVANTQWMLLVEFSQNAVLETANRFLRWLIVIGAVLLLAGFLIVLLVSRNLTRPINKLIEATATIAAGDFSQVVESSRNDEIGKLAHSFNSMIAQIRKGHEVLEQTVKDRTAQLESNLKQLKESEEKFKGLLESAPDAMIISDQSGKIVLANHQTEALFGFNNDELIDQQVELLLPGELMEKHKHHREGYFKHPKVRAMGAGLELFAVRKNGTRFPVEISLSPLETSDGLLVSAAIRDITERKKSEEAILELNKELESFTYSVSHDLRSPLRIINGYADILISDYLEKLDDEGNRTLNIIKTNAIRMGQLIDDLLSLSQVGRKDLVVHHTDMNKLVKSVVDEQLSLNGNKAIVHLDKLEPAECDSSLLRQVWINLLSNAIKYSAKNPNPKIWIRSGQINNEITYSIQDNGVGFDMKYAGKLFGVFQRLHKLTEFEGTGIGLALVNRILTKHNGKIWAESEPGKGATFFFSLPA